jgi:hypothetical protein
VFGRINNGDRFHHFLYPRRHVAAPPKHKSFAQTHTVRTLETTWALSPVNNARTSLTADKQMLPSSDGRDHIKSQDLKITHLLVFPLGFSELEELLHHHYVYRLVGNIRM